jgi:hypothetical protein
MPPATPYLSKSRLISAWQCPKRLYLEKFHPELAEISDNMEALFATGHEVGAIAQASYGTPESVEIPFDRKMSRMVRATHDLLASGARFPIFEATFEYDGILVRADVLIPDGDRWRLVEVKASTSVKDYHILDCAIQEWVLRNAGISLTSISLAHINNQFVYHGDGNYDGLLAQHDLTDEVKNVDPRVEDLIATACYFQRHAERGCRRALQQALRLHVCASLLARGLEVSDCRTGRQQGQARPVRGCRLPRHTRRTR